MKLPGRLDATTLGDLLGVLHRERATGILELVEWSGATAGRTHRVHVAQGLVERVDSPLHVEKLGDVLRREGFLDADAHRRLVRRLAESPLERAGSILVAEQKVPHTAVIAALRHQLRRQLDRLFELRTVRLRFHVARRASGEEARIPLSPREFLHGRPRARDATGRRSQPAPMRPPPSEPRRRALAVLGLSPTAAPDAVRSAFRRLARDLHPDRYPRATPHEMADLMRRFAELSAAYHQLVA